MLQQLLLVLLLQPQSAREEAVAETDAKIEDTKASLAFAATASSTAAELQQQQRQQLPPGSQPRVWWATTP